jgi:hypothetical protein
MPAEGGKPEAIEIPKHKGMAIKKTKNPANKSLRQLSFKPAKPILGNALVIISFINVSLLRRRV